MKQAQIKLEEAKKLFFPNNYCISHNAYQCDTCGKELKQKLDLRREAK